MFHKDVYRDALGVVRPDLRDQAIRDFLSLPVESGYVWRSVGPALGFIKAPSTLPKKSGLVSDLAIDSTLTDLVIGTSAGGVWRSGDSGVTWRALGDGLPSLQSVTVSRFDGGPGIDPVLITGAGSLDNEKLKMAGLAGVHRSVDGGKTWALLDGGPDATIFRSHDVNQVIAVAADRVLVATRVGLFFSKDGGRNFGNDADSKNGLPHLRGNVTAVVIEGSEVAAVIAGELTAVPEPTAPELGWQVATAHGDFGIWIATLGPGGLASFGPAPVHRTQALVADPEVGNTLLDRRGRFWIMSVAKRGLPKDSFADFAAHAGEHHSIQFTQMPPASAAGWGNLSSALLEIAQGNYSHIVGLDPLAAPAGPVPSIWFGTVGLFRGQVELSAGRWQWKAPSPVERGTSAITDMGDPNEQRVHADQHVVHSIQVAPGSRRTFIGNDGGLYRTDDDGATWISLNEHGSALFWTIALARKDATTLRIIAGLQDNGSIMGEGPIDPSVPTAWTWRDLRSHGDGGALSFVGSAPAHPPGDNPGSGFVTANGFLETISGAASLDSWLTAAAQVEVLDPARMGLPTLRERRAIRFPFSECLVVARGTTGDWDRLHYSFAEQRNGPSRLWKKEAAGAVTLNPFAFPAMITALAAGPADPATETAAPPGAWEHLWVGLANGQILFSSNAGTSFTPVPVPVPVAGKSPVTGISIDPTDSRRVAFVFGGFSEPARNAKSGKVVLTTDGGSSFTDISGVRGADGFVPDVPALGVAFTRTAPVALVVSTDIGALVTYDLGAHWKRLGVGLPRNPCTGLSVLNAFPTDPVPPIASGLPPLAVGTFGRGAFLLVRPALAEAVIEFDGAFGALRVGTTARQVITLYNPGGTELVATVAAAGPVFTFEPLPDTTVHVPPRDKRSWTVACSPTAAGVQSATLTVTVGANVTNVPVSCEAVTTGLPRLAIWPKVVRFGRVPEGTTVEETIHLVNRGQSDLHLTGVAPVAATAQFTLTAPPAVLTPGQEATITLRFTATTHGTSYTGSFRVTSDDPVAAPEHSQIDGSGQAIDPAPHHGIPGWFWWALAGALVGGGAIGAAIVLASKHDDQEH